MSAPEPDADGNALEIFAQWLARRERGEPVELDELLRRHPQFAAELAELDATWSRLRAAGDPSESRPSLHDRLETQFGKECIPEVGLPEQEPREDGGSFPSTLIAQIAGRKLSFGRYRIRGEIARGGMGAILKIWDEDLRRTLAMKVVLGKDESATTGHTPPIDSRTLGRFLEEAQVTGQLDHPGIVPVHELGLDSDGRVYFTMKLVKGEDLRQVYEHVLAGKDGWNQTRALGVLLKVCEALSYAHDKGVIHRDLKPANVMVGKYGEVYVMDWGLARVLGTQDRHDMRLQPEPQTSISVRTERREEREEAPDSPIMTMDGDVVGTPAYMPPEQARGETGALGAQSDVYAVGAMLYHLLAGQMPFVPRSAKVSARTVLMRVLEGSPVSVGTLAPDAPAELVAICEKAMARDAGLRYADTRAFAEDLRAFLEHRVVGAYETGTWAETRKWVQRNKPLAASVAAAVAIALTAVVWIAGKNDEVRAKNDQLTSANSELITAKQRADLKTKEAEENATAAARSAGEARQSAVTANRLRAEAEEQGRELRVRGLIQDFAAFEALDDSLDFARRVPRPASEWWLERAHQLVDGVQENAAEGTHWSPGLADAEARLAKLRERALPASEEDRAQDRAMRPRAKELPTLRAKFQWQARMLGLEAWPSEAESDSRLSKDSLLSTTADALNTRAWSLANPGARWATDVTNKIFGKEVDALVLARHAVDAASKEQRPQFQDTLAWALLWTSHSDDALAMERTALDEIDAWGTDPGQLRPLLSRHLELLEGEAGRWRGGNLEARRTEHDALANEITALDSQETVRHTWHFTDGNDEWWHAQLSEIVRDLGRARGQIAIAERSVLEPGTALGWKTAIEAISSSEQYRGVKWPNGTRLSPQLGLVPIGADPVSHLWEFSHLESGNVATRGPDRTIVLTPETGLVFVLLPGGRVPIDRVEQIEPGKIWQDAELTKVSLDPFFLSKYEITNEQWDRLDGLPHAWERHPKPMLPITLINWDDCAAVLSRTVAWIAMPTEAQWEYACRAGTTTPWWTGSDIASLRGAANIAFDQQEIESAVLTRIGSLRPNPLGLHDVHGNVWEWCRDPLIWAGGERHPGDGLFDALDESSRVLRGGSYISLAADARSSRRFGYTRDVRSMGSGLRPARGITP